MSSILIGGDTSGAITISAPAVSGTTTLTLPAVSGTILQSGTVVTVAQGGTGVTTSTGSGANVLGTSPTLTTPTISSLSSASATALTLQSAGTTAITVDTSQNVGIGTSSPASRLSSNVSGAGSVTALNLTNDNGGFAAGTGPAINFGVASGGTVGSFGKLEVLNQTATIGSNSYMAFSTRGGDVLAERMRIDSSGNVLVNSAAGLGYGTGSGGTVTQATSKSTSVTLNKPTGQITMNNAALSGANTVQFNLNNSLLAATDTLIVNVNLSGVAVAGSYSVRPCITPGLAQITLVNETGASLSEAVILNFAIIKGATS